MPPSSTRRSNYPPTLRVLPNALRTGRAPPTARAASRAGAAGGWRARAAGPAGRRRRRPSPRSGSGTRRRLSARPAAAAVEPLSTRTCHGSASSNSHWTVNGPAGAVRWSTTRATEVKSSSIAAGSRGGAPFGGPDEAGAQHRQAVLGALGGGHLEREHRRAGQGPQRQPGGAQLGLERARALGVDLLQREAEALRVGAVPVGRDEDRERVRRDAAHQVRDGVADARILVREVVQELDAEADVALLVQRDLPHPGAEAGQQLARSR